MRKVLGNINTGFETQPIDRQLLVDECVHNWECSMASFQLNKKLTDRETERIMELRSKQKINCLLVVLFFCVSILSTDIVLSQVNKLDEKNLEETMRNPWKPDRSVFLQDWLVLGSIPINAMEEIDKDFLAEYNGEANVQPTEGQVAKIAGNEMKWVPVKTKDIVDLRKLFQGGRTEDAVAYAYTTISQKEAGKIYLS
jgi:hypothetical protein